MLHLGNMFLGCECLFECLTQISREIVCNYLLLNKSIISKAKKDERIVLSRADRLGTDFLPSSTALYCDYEGTMPFVYKDY